jgi:hypothetical protein
MMVNFSNDDYIKALESLTDVFTSRDHLMVGREDEEK